MGPNRINFLVEKIIHYVNSINKSIVFNTRLICSASSVKLDSPDNYRVEEDKREKERKRKKKRRTTVLRTDTVQYSVLRTPYAERSDVISPLSWAVGPFPRPFSSSR
jgi:hypothetical protein